MITKINDVYSFETIKLIESERVGLFDILIKVYKTNELNPIATNMFKSSDSVIKIKVWVDEVVKNNNVFNKTL